MTAAGVGWEVVLAAGSRCGQGAPLPLVACPPSNADLNVRDLDDIHLGVMLWPCWGRIRTK
jgi:hypothetical protein